MNSFGLGLVLNFTDNASAGMLGVVGAFNQLDSATNSGQNMLVAIGGAMTTFGATLTAVSAPLTAFIGKMWSAGLAEASFIQNTAISLETFLGTAAAATEHLGKVTKFSYETPFEYEPLVAASQQLLVMGKNTDEAIDTLRLLGDTAGALGTDFSFVQNVLGIMGNINAEGKVSQIRMQQLMKTGMDLTGITKGMTAEAVWAQLEVNLAKYEGNMDKILGTWSGAVDYFQSAVAVAGNSLLGVFYDYDPELDTFVQHMEGLERLTEALRGVSDFIFALAPALEPLGETVISFLEGIVSILTQFKDWYENASEAQQNFVGQILQLIVLGGPVLLFGGKFLTMLGGFFTGGMKAAQGVSFLQKILGIFSSNILVGIAAALIFFTIWNNNLGGLRDKFENTFKRIIAVFQILTEYFRDGGLSYETFQKMNDLGLAPLVEGILHVKEQLGYLWEGIKVGFKSAIESVIDFMKQLGLIKDSGGDALADFGNFLKNIADPANIERWKEVGRVIGTVAVAIGALLIIGKVASLLSGVFSIFGGITGVVGKLFGGKTPAAAAGGAGGGMSFLASPVTVAKSMLSIAVIIGGFAAIIAAFGLLSQVPGFSTFMTSGVKVLADLFKGALPIALGAGVLVLFVAALTKLKISPASALKGMASLAIIIGGFAVIVAAFGAVAGLSTSTLSAGIGVLNLLVKGMTPVMPQLLIGVALIALMSLAMEKLKINPSITAKGMANIAIVLGGLGVIAAAFGAPGVRDFISMGVDTFSKLTDVIPQMLLTAAALILMCAVMDKFQVNPKSVAMGMAGIAIVLLGFEVIVTAMGALASIPGFSGFIASGAETISQMCAALPVENLIALAGLSAILVGLGFASPAVVAMGLAGLAIVILGFEAIIAALAALRMIPGFDDFMTSGGEVLAQLMNQLGAAVGSLIGGFGEGLTNSLPAIGKNIADFAKNIRPLFDVFSGVNTDSISGFLVALTAFIIGVTGEKMLSFFTGGIDLESLATQLSAFGVKASLFFMTVATYPDIGIAKSIEVFKALGAMSALPSSGGLLQAIIGQTMDLSVLGSQLASFAPNAGIFFSLVATYPEEGMQKSIQVFEALSHVSDLPYTGGILQAITGELNLSGIGRQLALFAPDGSIFFSAVSGYSEDGIEKTPRLFRVLSGISRLPFTGGILQAIVGEMDLGRIGRQLSAFAPHGVTFFNKMAVIDTVGFTNGQLALEALSKIGAMSGRSGGLVGGILDFFAGTTDFSQIGKQMTSYAESSKGFWDVAASYSPDAMENGLKALQVVSRLGGITFRSGGLLQGIIGEVDLSVVGTQLSNFSVAVKTFFDISQGFSATALHRGEEALQVLTILSDMSFRSGGLAQVSSGELDLRGIGDNLSGFAESVKVFFDTAKEISTDSIVTGERILTSLTSVEGLIKVANKMQDGRLPQLGQELSDFILNAEGFFDGTTGLTPSNITAMTEPLSAFFDVILTLDSDTLPSIATGFIDVTAATTDFRDSLQGLADWVSSNTSVVTSGITSMTKSCESVLSAFASKGSDYGKKLITSIAQSIRSNASSVKQALQSAVNTAGVTVTTPSSGKTKVSSSSKVMGLATGGETTGEGLALLHPNEVVVNSSITDGLRDLVSDYNAQKPTFSTSQYIVNNHQISPTAGANASQTQGASSDVYDYSITVSPGAFVFQVTKDTTQAELEQMGEQLMNFIERKQALKEMATRNKSNK